MSSSSAPSGASTLHLPPGDWPTVLDCLCAQFPAIPRAVWQQRFAAGRVLDAEHRPLAVGTPHRAHLCVRYFREVPDEPPIPFTETLLHADEHLVVVDKPHFLPVTPSGRFVEQSLLRRLMRRLGNDALTPLHRIDRATAGLVLLSASTATRDAYQALFRERRIAKRYLAVAPALPAVPPQRRSRIVPGQPFFRMQEGDGEPNSETVIECLHRHGDWAAYALYPHTGRKHQLRVHMAALGAPLRNDPLYPQLQPPADDVYDEPLQLLAESLQFRDPLSGEARVFRSRLQLCHWPLHGS